MTGYSASGQLTLPVRLDDSATLENFYLPSKSKNNHLVEVLADLNNTSGLYLWGDIGSGVPPLLQALCHSANKGQQSAIYIPLDEFNEQSPELILANLETMNLVCLDSIDSVVLNEEWAEQLFHFFNRAQANRCRLVFGANAAPANLTTPLADLQSRLSSLLMYRVAALSDEEKTQALIFRARRRGMDMPESVAQYLVTRYSRALADQLRTLDKLDQATLLEKRKLTVPFVKSVLEDAQHG